MYTPHHIKRNAHALWYKPVIHFRLGVIDNLYLMHWEVAVDWEWEVKGEAREAVVEKRYRVPDGYLDEVGRVRMLIGQIEAAGDDQVAIDEAYDKLLVMMKGG